MPSKYLRYFAVLTVVALVMSSAFVVAEEIRHPSTLTETVEIKPPAEKKATQPGITIASGAASTAATSTKSSDGVPTPAKRKQVAATTKSAELMPEDAPIVQSQPQPNAEPADVQAKAKTTDDPLQPIPDAMEGGPVAIEAASFNGVVPGISTRDDVEKAWGQAKETADLKDSLVQLFSIPPFNNIEVNYEGEKVSSIVVRFEQAFSAATIAKQLDLATVRPVLVSNELGEVLGLSYPERGVLFAFETVEKSDKPTMKVSQLVLEPISAEPFVLRAETTLQSRCDLSRRDLEQALSLEPDNARAHWLHARILSTMGQYEKAAVAAGQAVRLEPNNPQYRVTRAQALAQMGLFAEAIDEAEKAVESGELRQHVKARALCLIGDLTASGTKPDYKKALGYHTQALQVADPLTSSPHPAIRIPAKEVLVDAHLGAAHDIAWGDWKEKNKAVARWIDRAVTVATDLADNEGAGREQLFRVHVRAMAAYTGLRGSIDPESTIKAAVAVGDELIAAASDPVHRSKFQWELGQALYDGVQVCQMRSDHVHALQCGEKAAEYLIKAGETKEGNSSSLLLGRLYFRLGAIEALNNRDHRKAVVWFNKALPLLEDQSPDELAADLGRHGESFVSMGVSYWEAGQQKKAVELTEKGIKWMEQALKQGTIAQSALAVPYNNLAAMHRKLGDSEKADSFQEMASRAKKETVK